MKLCLLMSLLLLCTGSAMGQQSNPEPNERRVALTEAAVALDVSGSPALEATLSTTGNGLNGTTESPVTSVRIVIKNTSPTAYSFVSGIVTFYDNAGVRCGEGLFKADVLAANESFETDTPGIRIRCTPVTWRLVASSLIPRTTPPIPVKTAGNLLISVDGEQHPIQIGKPLTLTLSSRRHTIVLSETP